MLLVAMVAFAVGAPADCTDTTATDGGGGRGSLSSSAREEIPPQAARMYVEIAKRFDIDVAFLAAIGKQECDHGRCPSLKTVNWAGCVGWMQLGVGGKCGHYWDRNKCDGNHDGRIDVLDPWDNICASAKGLRHEKGAPRTGGSAAAYRAAAGRYYGACHGNGVAYCDQVMGHAKAYGFRPGHRTTTLAQVGPADGPAGCADPDAGARMELASLGDGPGKPFDVLPNANRPGAPLTREMVAVTRQIAGRLPRRLKVCTGTNHNQRSTSGNVSDHWAGNGVDLCSSANGFPASGGGYGDTMAAAAFMTAGKPRTEALRLARKGGAFTLHHGGLRLQIIWKSQVGGNHNDHIHVGIARLAGRAA
ncbi:MAG: hypothetical protein AB7G37_10800 [Solirubrobacteraceae bacterium]